jgi:hypothetical protein
MNDLPWAEVVALPAHRHVGALYTITGLHWQCASSWGFKVRLEDLTVCLTFYPKEIHWFAYQWDPESEDNELIEKMSDTDKLSEVAVSWTWIRDQIIGG